jgi:polyferredoxin
VKKKTLKVLPPDRPASSLYADGRRNHVHPADVHGRYTRARSVVFFVLIGVYVLLPWIQIGGAPAVFLDIAARRFYLFGLSFNAQDTWLLFFLLSGAGFALFVLTALLGRMWCGYACPQTVFLEGVFRKIERWIEGPRNQRLRRNAGPWTLQKIALKVVKHSIFVLCSAAVAHVFLSYFVSLPELF